MKLFKHIKTIEKWGLAEWLSYAGLCITLMGSGMGLFNDPVFGWSSYPLLILGLLILIIIPLIRVIIYYKKFYIFPTNGDGSEFILNKIKEACKRDSHIFSTFLLERAKDNKDIVTSTLKEEISSADISATVEYERFIMIDDPTQEKEWITGFLDVNNNASKLTIKPMVYACESPSRPFVRLIQALIPRLSLTLIKDAEKNGDDKNEALVYISLSDSIDLNGTPTTSKFGIAFYSNSIHFLLDQFIRINFLRHHDKIRTFYKSDEYEQKTSSSIEDENTNRLLDEVEEIALANVNIKHVGVFGSYTKATENNKKMQIIWKEDSDLDFLIVIEENTDKEELKRYIEKRLITQISTKNRKEFEIEWSNERTNFYYFRKNYHVDIQLHYVNDRYYSVETPLLGYAIFSQNYYELYSKNNLPVSRFIEIPQYPLSIKERIDYFLKDQLGINTFIYECSKQNPFIDPRRVFSINVCNFVWVISGMRPQSYNQALLFIRNKVNLPLMQKKSIIQIAKNIKGMKLEPNTDLQSNLLKMVLKVLIIFRNYLNNINSEHYVCPYSNDCMEVN